MPKAGFFSRNVRTLNRYREILFILLKHGFGDILSRLRVNPRPAKKHQKKFSPHLTLWERVRLAIEELGPTFVKFGQIMSNRPDLLPPALMQELSKLQDRVPPFDGKLAASLIEKETGSTLDAVFAEFNPKPEASASIAQVHHAVLLDGTEVALKIQRPDIEEKINTDIEIMLHLASLAEHTMEEARLLRPVEIIREFGRVIHRELDFLSEMGHIMAFQTNFSKDSSTYVPQVFEDLCSRRLLVMEFIHGTRLSEIGASRDVETQRQIGKNGAQLLLKQIFNFGYFHADPHPGNIFILSDNRVCFLDFGMVGVLSPAQRDLLGDLIMSAVSRDAHQLTRVFLKLSQNTHVEHPEELENQVGELLNRYYYLPVKKIHVGDFIGEMLDLLVYHRLRMLPCLYLLLKTLMCADGIGKQLDPDFNVLQEAKPFAKRLIRNRLDPAHLMKKSLSSLNELQGLVSELPENAREILSLLKQGKLKLEFEHKGLEGANQTLQVISSRFIVTILLAAIIIGSSLIVVAGTPPQVMGIPVLGLAGYLVSGLISIGLVINILWQRNF